MKNFMKRDIVLLMIIGMVPFISKAQPQVTVTLAESLGSCDLVTDCDLGIICVDIVMSVNQTKVLDSYNVWVQYKGNVISREAAGPNDNSGQGDNTCPLSNAGSDTDMEFPTPPRDWWRVAALGGGSGCCFPMTANVSYRMHTICFEILQPNLLAGQIVCTGGDTLGLNTTVTFTDGTDDLSIPNTCFTLDENFISCSLLPIRLLDFEVTKRDRTAVLDWTTTYESNLNYFEVQKAGEDKHFTAVGKVSGAGNSTSIQSYRFVDSSPFSGTNYYRLRSLDFDGHEDYSPIRSVQFETRIPRFSIRPNPVVDEIFITSDDLNSGPAYISIMSLDGLSLYHSALDDQSGTNRVSMKEFQPGIYQVIIRGNGYEWHEKVAKVE